MGEKMKIFKSCGKKKFAVIAAVMLAVLSVVGCSGGDDRIETIPAETAEVETEKYENEDFSMEIPKGWKVTYGGSGMYHSIRVQDPDEPLNQMFVLLKADALLHSEEGKKAWQYNYDSGSSGAYLFTLAPVLSEPSTESFFKIFPQYVKFAKEAEPSYASYEFPEFSDFSVVESFDAPESPLKDYSIGEKILRADFNAGEKAGEGMFSAAVTDFGSVSIAAGNPVGYTIPSADGGYYMAYNVMAITAAKDSFIDWEETLTSCMGTLEYSESYVNATKQAGQEQVRQSMEISKNNDAILSGIMSSWENRNKSADIASQKQSDATLGYERVYDTETGDIYKAENGFTDGYDGDRFEPITDDMYAEAISGYIE